MEVTEVRVKLTNDRTDRKERLRAFCCITIDGVFVVRDLKVIEGVNGLFVAMPSRKIGDRCGKCGVKNHLRARYCNHCGRQLDEHRAPRDSEGRDKLFCDIAHPIVPGARAMIERAVVEAYREELVLARQPGYVSTYDDIDHEHEVAFARMAMRRSA
ncbi:SpoVG family protein [Singulisphaera sp. PoT]|uniref:SpoVG family protein n=1 Tax=Singulisphaera sp. PoT TaxID=3411797 RepID=UPI003BF4E618